MVTFNPSSKCCGSGATTYKSDLTSQTFLDFGKDERIPDETSLVVFDSSSQRRQLCFKEELQQELLDGRFGFYHSIDSFINSFKDARHSYQDGGFQFTNIVHQRLLIATIVSNFGSSKQEKSLAKDIKDMCQGQVGHEYISLFNRATDNVKILFHGGNCRDQCRMRQHDSFGHATIVINDEDEETSKDV